MSHHRRPGRFVWVRSAHGTRARRIHVGWSVGSVAAVALLAAVTTSGCFVPIPGVSCSLMPADSFWRADVSAQPLHARSANYVAAVGTTRGLKADFGSGLWDGGPIGIPYDVVPGTQPPVPVAFGYDDQSDPGPYPIAASPHIEGGPASSGDRHVLTVDKDHCKLYETWSTYPDGNGGWDAGSGAIFDLSSNQMRPDTWTSADAAGLPILPGLVRYEEVEQGDVHHAIRITVPHTQTAYVWPASHQAGDTSNLNTPPMGTWFRLKSTVDETRVDPFVRPIIRALKTFGAVVADNGSSWFMSGVPDERWDNDVLQTLGNIKGSDFEAVDVLKPGTSIRVAANSYQATTAG